MSSLVDDGFSRREASESVHNLENVENKDDVCLFLNNEDHIDKQINNPSHWYCSPFKFQKWLTCSFSPSHPSITQQTGKENSQSYLVEPVTYLD